MNNKTLPNSHSEIELSIAQERLRQARYSFNLALGATALSFCISFVGTLLLLTGKASEGTVITAVGLISSVQCLKFAKEFNK